MESGHRVLASKYVMKQSHRMLLKAFGSVNEPMHSPEQDHISCTIIIHQKGKHFVSFLFRGADPRGGNSIFNCHKESH